MRGNKIKYILPGVILLAAVVLFVMRAAGIVSAESVASFASANRELAKYAMFMLYLFSPLLLLPTVYLTLMAGMLWGPFWGVVIDLSGATLGSTVAFVVSRYIARDFVRARIGSNAIGAYLQRETTGWKLNAFLRLNPIFPSGMIGYFFGLTSTPLVEFSLSTFVFLIPACVVVVLFGSSVGDLAARSDGAALLVKLSFLAASALAWVALVNLARRRAAEKKGT